MEASLAPGRGPPTPFPPRLGLSGPKLSKTKWAKHSFLCVKQQAHRPGWTVAPWGPRVTGISWLTVCRIISSTERGGGLGTLSEWREVPGPRKEALGQVAPGPGSVPAVGGGCGNGWG